MTFLNRGGAAGVSVGNLELRLYSTLEQQVE